MVSPLAKSYKALQKRNKIFKRNVSFTNTQMLGLWVEARQALDFK